MTDCLFCKIANGEIPGDIVYEDGDVLCFRDIAPQAPVHVLIIPRKHVASLDELSEDDGWLMGRLLLKVSEIAGLLGLENGYRLVCNCGEDGMQTVGHLHFHLLGKRKLAWPPG